MADVFTKFNIKLEWMRSGYGKKSFAETFKKLAGMILGNSINLAGFEYIYGVHGKLNTRKECMMISKKKRQPENEPTIAPGLDDQDILEQSATEEEIQNGEYTNVTTLSYDEVGPS